MGYNDEALRRGYYVGLKDKVKDKLMRTDALKTFPLLVKLAIQLDKRIYQRRREKQGKQSPRFVPFKKTSKIVTKKPYYGPMPMEIDSIQKQPTRKQPPRTISKGNCYNCGKAGHYSRQCCMSQKINENPHKGGGQQVRTIAAATQEQKDHKLIRHGNLSASRCWMANCQDHGKETSHNAMSWTVCYDDLYSIYLSDKEGLGWFLKELQVRPLGEIISDCASEEFGIIKE